MERSDIQAYLAEFAHPYADKRVNIFDIEILDFQPDVLTLRGSLLDASQRQSLAAGLSQRFPGLRIDIERVEVARQTPARLLSVATNLTSMHANPSFLAEQVTQLLNGAVVEVLKEQPRWVYVRQLDGYLGWTYGPYLTEAPVPQASHLVVGPLALLCEQPGAEERPITRVLGGTAVCWIEQKVDWARVELAGGWMGWLPVVSLRALDCLPQSPVDRRAQLVADAFRMTGVPYLWGGTSANGIDCSGFAQLLHRWVGLTLPRDADMQFAAGQPVESPFEPGDLLFFGEQGEQRRITHVGVSLGGWRMIHSSRSRNGVQVDDVQAVDHLRDSYLCAATFIGR